MKPRFYVVQASAAVAFTACSLAFLLSFFTILYNGFTSTCYAQENSTEGVVQVVKANGVETLDLSAWDASVTSERVERLLVEAVKTAKLRPFQKIRANLILKTNFAPKIKQQMILEATSKLIEDGKVSTQTGDVIALVDWDAIFAFLEKLLPLLLQLFG